MHVIRSLSCAVLLAFGAVSSVAMAEGSVGGEVRPLVVIRFNQPNVYFDQQLYGAVSKAVSVKPEVTFEIVSIAPATGNAVSDAQWVKAASQNTQRVVASMQQMGVPMERMRVTGRAQAGLRNDETQVFVY